MPYKLLSNLIKSPAVHRAGEILELDAQTAENLLKRGLVEKVEAAATHLFGQTTEGMARGGKPVNDEAAAPSAPAAPVAPTDDVPQVNTSHADPVGEAKDQHAAPVQPAAQPQPQTSAPSPQQQPTATPSQPTPEEIAAAADAAA